MIPEEKAKKYYLGLDIGTNSVGYCVTDENYNVIEGKRKIYEVIDGKRIIKQTYHNHLWGSRLFEECKVAKSRRTNRTTRRRIARRRWRVMLLRSLFEKSIEAVDPLFFKKLDASFLHNEDREPDLRFDPFLFVHPKASGKAKKEPDKNDFTKTTIYHLRERMIQNPDTKFDIRLVYLVLEHMIKYRGNFLFEGNFSSIGNDPQYLADKFNEMNEILDNIFEHAEGAENIIHFNITLKQAKELNTAFMITTKVKELGAKEDKIFGKLKDIRLWLLSLINGSSSVTAGKLIPSLKEDEDLGKKKIDFSDENFEDTLNSLGLDENYYQLILSTKSIYDYRILANLLKGKSSLSEAMISIYDTHKNQLGELKDLYKEFANKEQYDNMFRNASAEKTHSYANYIGYTKTRKGRICCAKYTKLEDLVKQIKTDLSFDKLKNVINERINNAQGYDKKKYADLLEKYEDLAKEIDNLDFLPKQNNKNNGVLPYQLNENEMRKILENQGKFYPFLLDKAPAYPNSEKQDYKIISLLKFKIPYYIGPLSRKSNMNKDPNQWAQRKEEGRITPWNFSQLIDLDKSADVFIERMKKTDTYIFGEKTLPKCSLIYQSYLVLNDLNNLLINNAPIIEEDKNYLIEKVFFKQKKVSEESLKAALKEKYKEEVTITTRNSESLSENPIQSSLSSFIDLSNDKAFGKNFYSDSKTFNLAETVIELITIVEDKDLLEKRLNKLGLTRIQIKYLKNLRFTGWAKFSKKLLCGLKTKDVNPKTGEIIEYSILDLLLHTSKNFMEIYEGGYDFKKQVADLNSALVESREDLIENSYASPAMKRAIRQSFKLIDELKRVLKIDFFTKIFVECTRAPQDDKKRTFSRKKQIQEAYKAVGGIVDKEALDNLNKALVTYDDSSLHKKKIFLYFMQFGKSLYSGEDIDLSNLKNYDIDHIIPQAKVKDGSFNNIVLVERNLNNKKEDSYPIPKDILSEKGRDFVNKLGHLKNSFFFMPKSKMERILRIRPLSDEEIVGFVNRQLTITNQAVRAVCEILNETEKNTQIIYSKAGQVSDFRATFDLVKVRDINDLHHANDAYLNIVVGNVYNDTFGNRFTIEKYKELQSGKKNYSLKLNAEKFFRKTHQRGNNVYWLSPRYKEIRNNDGTKVYERVDSTPGTIDTVTKFMALNDPIVTQMTYTNTGKQGFFNKITIHPVRDEKAKFPLKQSQPLSGAGWQEKYGGYADLTNPYFMLVESDGKKGKKNYSLESIPSVYLASFNKFSKNRCLEAKLDYLRVHNKLKNPKILIDKLLMRTILKVPYKTTEGKEGYVKLGITGKSGKSIICINLSELFLPKDLQKYYKQISNVFGTNLPANQKKDLSKFDQETNDSIKDGKNILTRENNERLFNYLINVVLKKPMYEGLPTINGSFIKLKKMNSEFLRLSTFKQAKVLISIIKLLSCKSAQGNDLSVFNGLSQNLGVIHLNKNLVPQTKIFVTSTTGLFEKILFTVPKD